MPTSEQKATLQIARGLIGRDVPDVLIGEILDFVGDPCESIPHMYNSTCFYRVRSIKDNMKFFEGHWCKVCRKFYQSLKSTKQLSIHTRSHYHNYRLRCHIEDIFDEWSDEMILKHLKIRYRFKKPIILTPRKYYHLDFDGKYSIK